MSPVASRSHAPLRAVHPGRAGAVIAVLAVAGLLIASMLLLPAPLDTRDLTIANRHAWGAFVEVEADGGWVAIGTVRRESSRSFSDVPSSDPLTLRFTYHDVSVVTSVTEDELEAADGVVMVPDEFAAALAEEQLAPTATSE